MSRRRNIFTFTGMFYGIIFGFMLLGFSEIINLLQLNVYKVEKMMKALLPEKDANQTEG